MNKDYASSINPSLGVVSKEFRVSRKYTKLTNEDCKYINGGYEKNDKYAKIDKVRKDDRLYVKVFPEFYRVIPKLSSSAIKVLFEFVFMNLEMNNDIVYICSEDVISKLNISKRNYYSSLNNLIANKVLIPKKHTNNFFFINLAFFCNGNSVNICDKAIQKNGKQTFEEFMKKKESEEIADRICDMINSNDYINN